MNWRFGLILFCLIHGVLLLVPAWAPGYAPLSGAWGWGIPASEIQMHWYGQALGAGLAFFLGTRLKMRCREAWVGVAVLFDLAVVAGTQIAHLAAVTS